MGRSGPSRDAEITKQRKHADDDDDDPHDLLGTAVDRQHVDEVENENDDKKRYQNADQYAGGHGSPLCEESPGQRRFRRKVPKPEPGMLYCDDHWSRS